MDYSLAAVKVMCVQLKAARESHSQSAALLGGLLFQRAWLQGVLVSLPAADGDDGRFLLDDGTGVIELLIQGEFRNRDYQIGMYLMVVGGFYVRGDDLPMIKVHKIVDLSPFPDREVMWYLEVLEAYKLFYQQLIDE